MLELCMFAESSVDSEHLTIVGDEGKIESLLPSVTLRYGKRDDWGRREVWGQASGTGRGVSVRRVWDTDIRYEGQHFGASHHWDQSRTRRRDLGIVGLHGGRHHDDLGAAEEHRDRHGNAGRGRRSLP